MKKIAHLVYEEQEETDEYGSFIRSFTTITRMTNPVIDGKFTSGGWFSPFRIVKEEVQNLANKYGEVIYDKTRGRYIYPNKEEAIKNEKKI